MKAKKINLHILQRRKTEGGGGQSSDLVFFDRRSIASVKYCKFLCSQKVVHKNGILLDKP